MTAQISDRVRYGGVEYTLLGPRTGLFVPVAHGIETRPMHTACWRGFHCLYVLTDRLRLAHVHLQMAYADPTTTLFGKPPVHYDAGRAEYRDLDHPIELTARLWLGAGFIQELYVHMGFQAPYRYQTVLEIALDRGVPASVEDKSSAMSAMRARLAAGKISEAQLARWLSDHLG